MTRVDHIRHAFSVSQMESLHDLLAEKEINLHKENKSLPDEEKYAMELLKMAKDKIII